MPIQYIPHPIRATVNNVTGARALGVWYTNATLRPILCICTTRHISPGAAASGYATASNRLGGVPTVIGSTGHLAGIFHDANYCLVWTVPPGQDYSLTAVVAGGGSVALVRWIEVNL